MIAKECPLHDLVHAHDRGVDHLRIMSLDGHFTQWIKMLRHLRARVYG
jgi:hypothetical protein